MAAADVPVGVDSLDREQIVKRRRTAGAERDDITHGPPSASVGLPFDGPHRHGSEETPTTAPNRAELPLHRLPASSPSGCAPRGLDVRLPTATPLAARGENRGRAQVDPKIPIS